ICLILSHRSAFTCSYYLASLSFFISLLPRPPRSPLFPYTTLFRSAGSADYIDGRPFGFVTALDVMGSWPAKQDLHLEMDAATSRSEEHTSELQSLAYLVCRLLLEKKKKKKIQKHKM